MKEIYNQLKEKGVPYAVEFNIKRFFGNVFSIFYNTCPYEEHWNFSIPEDYLWFLEKSGDTGVAFPGINHFIYGLSQVISDTVSDMESFGDKEGSPVFWLYVGDRFDKGFFFICCDKRSDLYGHVCEFYDGSPFMNLEYYDCSLGDFKTFCTTLMNEESKNKKNA